MEKEDIPHSDKRKIGGDWWRFFTEKKTGRLLSLGVYPLAMAYSGGVTVRRKLYSSKLRPTRKLPCRVLSVGNLTMGGSGKTPAVISIAGTLAGNGVKTAVISRGYKGEYTSRAAIVSDGESIFMGPREAGDEPCMIAETLPSVPVIVGRDRYSAGMLAWEEFGVRAVVLDDGYQQLGLVKDLNILVVNSKSTRGELRLFPLGALREPLSQVSRADVILYTKCDGAGEPPLLPATGVEKPVFYSRYRTKGLRKIGDRSLIPPGNATGKRILAFCGIADPASFLSSLKEMGLAIADFITYPDHYRYTPADLAELTNKSNTAGAEMIITTEKDAVKIREYLPENHPFWAMNVELDILEHNDEWEWYLMGALKG